MNALKFISMLVVVPSKVSYCLACDALLVHAHGGENVRQNS